jgi:allantoinase
VDPHPSRSSACIAYPHEINDVPMIALNHGTAAAFADAIIDNFEEMLRQC